MEIKGNKKILSYLQENGKSYTPAILPEHIARGEPGDCYDTSMLAVINNYPKLKYVEGMAKIPGQEDWVLHAWVTDESGVAYDPTWKAFDQTGKQKPIPTTYIGIEMDFLLVAQFVKATEYKGIFANYWRNREIANKLLKDF